MEPEFGSQWRTVVLNMTAIMMVNPSLFPSPSFPEGYAIERLVDGRSSFQTTAHDRHALPEK